MYENPLVASVRSVNDNASIIDIQGEVTANGEGALMQAYNQASSNGAEFILLNFSEMEYMNSSGIGLLVTILIRAQRQGQKLLAYGLKEHFRKIFELTRLNEAIKCYSSEEEALEAAESAVRPAS